PVERALADRQGLVPKVVVEQASTFVEASAARVFGEFSESADEQVAQQRMEEQRRALADGEKPTDGRVRNGLARDAHAEQQFCPRRVDDGRDGEEHQRL